MFHPGEIEDILVECARSTKIAARTLFPDIFTAEFSPLHDQIFEAIDSPHNKICIAAPRGIGKTSICKALAAKSILFRLRNFITYVSQSATAAQLQTENLKHELLSNENIRSLFGSVKAGRAEGFDETFSKMMWVGMNTLVFPRGSGQQVRGILYHTHRPDLIIIDDLEDTDTIENDEMRSKRMNWLYGDLLKAVSRVEKNYKIVYIDTLKHEDALIQRLLDSPDWLSIRQELCNNKLISNVPSFYSDDDIRREYEEHRAMGLLDVFYREYRNIAIATEDAVFKPDYFQYYDETKLEERSEIENFIVVDPAKTVKIHSAESAVVCVGFHRKTGAIYIRDIVADRLHPDELYEAIFEMAARMKCRVVGIEVTSLNEFITQPIKNEMSRRGIFFTLIELKARGKKEDRIARMSSYYRQGFVYHNPLCCQPLEDQLLSFPRSARFDVMDAAAYFIEMLDIGDIYTEPPEGFDPDFDDESEEYEDLNAPEWASAPGRIYAAFE